MKKILLIDDNEDITTQIGKFLKLKGFDCTETNSGSNGLELICTSKFDHVMLDLSMPDFTGFDVISELETKHLLNSLSLTVFTASQITSEMRSKLHEKNIKILEKPIQLKELMAIIGPPN